MDRPHSDAYYKAMESKLGKLNDMKEYDIGPFKESEGKTVLDSIWAFKTEQYPDRPIRKYKSRLCVCGDQQQHMFDFLTPMHLWLTGTQSCFCLF